jgi:phospholipid transport system substrate-binding protein
MSGVFDRPVSRRALAALLGGLVAAAATGTAHASPAAEAYVTRIAEDVMALANSGGSGKPLKSKFAALLNRYINLRSIANYALGPWQKKLPEADRDMFYDLVSNYAAALFVYYVNDFKGSKLEIKSTSTQGKFITIQSAIKLRDGGSEAVRWRLVPAGGSFRVSDVNLKGVWLTISMQDRFKKVLNKSKGDFDALYAELREAETW